ncbi:MAG TPA: YeeE/YedE family protein [Paracoccaceae bacterium]|nr:YeeE/YedE family protein [Paracoccaceae bacterium]
MNPDWITGLVGGLMIGSAAGVLLLGNGRIAGVSGILGQLVDRTLPADWAERLLFIAGLFIAPLVYLIFADKPEIVATGNIALLAAGGLIVGIGSRMGSGCTSGHGVSGAARLSKRSIVAMITFMTTGIATVALMNALV